MLIAGNAQINDSVFVVPDTLQPFSLADFYELILRHHPVARQAYQLPEVARQEIRLAQGNFDPRLETEYKVKHYNHTEYYRLFEGAIKLPTRSPVTPTLGVKRHKGQFINPQEYISDKYDYR